MCGIAHGWDLLGLHRGLFWIWMTNMVSHPVTEFSTNHFCFQLLRIDVCIPTMMYFISWSIDNALFTSKITNLIGNFFVEC